MPILTSLESARITALATTLLRDHRTVLVKPLHRRALHGRPDEGRRVTEFGIEIRVEAVGVLLLDDLVDDVAHVACLSPHVRPSIFLRYARNTSPPWEARCEMCSD